MAIRTYKGKCPLIGARAFVDDTAVVIGDVELGEDVSIWPTSVVRGDVERIKIGNGTNVQDGAVLHVSHAGDFSPKGHPLNIGRGVTIGHRAVVHACTIGNYCLIGIGAIVMDDAELGDYVMLGAGALVTPGKKLESGFLYVGAPAKQIRALTDAEKEFLEYSAKHYVRLKDDYLD
ncbi:gamma carbonic anhydrase family protein [Methylomonas sp. EFPC3]|uniref:gamma carbonic anhydrase family protein n=1 Tax=Methylomonas sp. EFPC3 TaxID=3021710 RepID=UPI0024180535|nr:gamma carbonic anhydrase family protein [Methylomonas sp. EFPC3]WFP50792.1 gamma carbonic anhydrase family protein [Methylomonas sp. EFPC3]